METENSVSIKDRLTEMGHRESDNNLTDEEALYKTVKKLRNHFIGKVLPSFRSKTYSESEAVEEMVFLGVASNHGEAISFLEQMANLNLLSYASGYRLRVERTGSSSQPERHYRFSV